MERLDKAASDRIDSLTDEQRHFIADQVLDLIEFIKETLENKITDNDIAWLIRHYAE